MIFERVPYIYAVRVYLRYKGVTYSYEEMFEDAHMADYQYREGNYACDCNRSLFIGRYCDPDFPELVCGEEIELVALTPVETIIAEASHERLG